MSELFAALYDPVLAPLEAMGLRKWRQWATRAARVDAKDAESMRRVLEIGVGTGANLRHYRDGQTIAAIDPDGASLRRARVKRNENAAIYLQQARAEELPFADESFDAVIGTLTFCTIADPARGLGEVYRVLKTRGTLRLVEHVRGSNRVLAGIQDALTPVWKVIADGCHLNRDTASAVARAGFQVRTVQKRFGGILVGIDAVK